jgi:UDP-glucose 4-epimerase
LRTILITGGAGYIGSHTAKALLDIGYKVIIVDNLSSGSLEAVDERAQFIKMNAFNETELGQLLRKEKIDGVLHCAGEIIVSESMEDPSKYVSANVSGMNKLLKVLADHEIDKLVFSSTASVYGNNCLDCAATEMTPLDPINPYADTKHMGERLIYWMATRYKWKYVIFRYFNVAGAEMDSSNGLRVKRPTHIIPNINKTALGYNNEFNIYGTDYNTKDGTCIRDYIHILDIANSHVLAFEYLFSENSSSEILNLGTEKGYSVKEILDTAQEIIGHEIPNRVEERREGDPASVLADASKARNILGWVPKYDLKDIIKSDYDWRVSMKEKLN